MANPEAPRPTRISQLLTELRSTNKTFSEKQFWLKKNITFHTKKNPIQEVLESEGLNIPHDIIATFGIKDEDNKKWVFAQKHKSQGFIAMQFEDTQKKKSFNNASAIIAVEFNSEKKPNRIIFSNRRTDKRVVAAQYLFHSNGLICSLDEVIFNVIGQENFLDDLLVGQPSLFISKKMINSNSNFLRIFNPWHDGDMSSLRFWSKSGDNNTKENHIIMGRLNILNLKHSFKI